ncbi:hypothetical protein [Cyanobium sp. Morenito 9A2]|uniref:hypothetical protein n=1 Tax=Cyanobium sp. Morenito 9A2 TaxID=2823718 RepID=UPI0020CCB030|nr:hypothetical protein [Cyanobium sp. Morenito 9A2]MCP9851154.1 hypothetical protein [Cyanobium sp. Morenito 9A2]
MLILTLLVALVLGLNHVMLEPLTAALTPLFELQGWWPWLVLGLGAWVLAGPRG